MIAAHRHGSSRSRQAGGQVQGEAGDPQVLELGAGLEDVGGGGEVPEPGCSSAGRGDAGRGWVGGPPTNGPGARQPHRDRRTRPLECR
jgi:hypothetical protein